jgi:hypothetical protein
MAEHCLDQLVEAVRLRLGAGMQLSANRPWARGLTNGGEERQGQANSFSPGSIFRGAAPTIEQLNGCFTIGQPLPEMPVNYLTQERGRSAVVGPLEPESTEGKIGRRSASRGRSDQPAVEPVFRRHHRSGLRPSELR